MTFKFIVLVISLLFSVHLSESARILAVFPTPSISHQVVFRPLTQELARRGHEVVVLTTDPAFPKGQAPANLTEIDVHDISYEIWIKELMEHTNGKENNLYSQFKTIIDLQLTMFYEQLKTREIKKIIDERQQFDLIFLEACHRPAITFIHLFKAPVILISSFGTVWPNLENLGAPVHPILYPAIYHRRLYNLSLSEKITILYDEWKFRGLFIDTEINNKNKEIFGPDTPSLHELSNNIDMLFLNIHPIWNGNAPWPPSIIHTWGIHHKPEKALPQDLQSYLDSSQNGVIYMSFGTNVDPANLPSERIQMFINTFSKLPYDILWKWSRDELPGKTKNIKISKWLPQSDLLRHPKVKLFITQGGLQSTDESIVAGVPLIGIPMFTDQWYNVEKYVHHGIGLKISLETVTEEELTYAINEVINNERYRNNIKKMGALMRDEPMSGLQRAVWWTEHVLRHGGARHLRAPAANISWAQYLELELVFILLLIFVSAIILVFSGFRMFYRLFTRFSFDIAKTKTN